MSNPPRKIFRRQVKVGDIICTVNPDFLSSEAGIITLYLVLEEVSTSRQTGFETWSLKEQKKRRFNIFLPDNDCEIWLVAQSED